MKSSQKPGSGNYRVFRRLPALKMKMTTGTDFTAIFHFFFEHFGENPEFMKLGKKIDHPLLAQILAHVARSVFAKVSTPTRSEFVHLPDQHLIHGFCMFDDVMASFFYFEDLDAGMVSLITPRSARVQIVRFSMKQMGKVSPSSAN
jgi:hypothetical protein